LGYYLLILAIIAAVIEWVAVGKRWRKVEYFAKPGVMIFLIAWLVLSGGLRQNNLLWFTGGAFFSLLGDIFLLLRWDRLGFTLGLSFFLLAHLSYIAGFRSPPLVYGPHLLVLGAVILVSLGWVGWRVLSSLYRRGPRRLVGPVTVYILAISSMLFSALSTSINPGWMSFPALLVGIGAASFTFSDTFLAWDKFVRPLRYGRIVVMVTYHLGQMALLIGANVQYM
jgi:uncharacterized membrane protein YhhN